MKKKVTAEDVPLIMNELMNYSDRVFRICLGISRNPWDAEELMQEVYLQALRKINTLRDPERKREWIFRITRNICLNKVKRHSLYLRRLERMDVPTADHRSPEWQMLLSEEIGILKEAVQDLPRILREVLLLKEYGHLSYREIADVLKIKEGTVMSRLNRARMIILDRLKGGSHG